MLMDIAMADTNVDAISSSILSAGERFTGAQSITPTQKRLLYEFLAYPGRNGKTLSGLFADGMQPNRDAPLDLLYITTRWFGLHIIKHYYRMRQYKEASTVTSNFLKYLKAEGSLPNSMTKELDAAIQVS